MKPAQQPQPHTTPLVARRPVQIKATTLDVQLNNLAHQLGVTLKELAPLLQLSESTLHRRRNTPGQPKLNGPASERMALLTSIVEHGLRVYSGNQPALQDWLRYPLGELNGRTPLQALTTIAGFTEVDDVLGRIEHGIFF